MGSLRVVEENGEQRVYGLHDRSLWTRGPWDDEPDRVQWMDGDFVCLAKRVNLGHWCGYIGVPKGHSWHGSFADLGEPHVQCHGGCTYSGTCSPAVVDGVEVGVCHASDGDDDVWWIGFDCAHAGDGSPRPSICGGGLCATYRTLDFVRGEIRRLVEQARLEVRDA